MPSRKSDVRRSDVSAVSRPADDEDSPMTSTAAHLPQEPDSSSATPAIAPPEQSSSETPQVGESNPATSEKGKDKEKERERERERREDAITIEDLNLPKSIITRLAKGVLPPNTQIQANAILALSKSATVFISHLSNAANEWTMSGGKKTIMPADVFRALDDIEYGFMREKLEAEFAKFNENQSTKRSAYRRKVSAAKRAARGGGDGSVADSSVLSTGTGAADESMMGADTTMGTEADAGDGGEARAAKKARVDAAAGEGKMEVDGDGEVSDAETQPDEHVDEDEDDDEQEEEEDEEEDEAEGEGGENGEDDELEERTGREVEDEALDEDSE
ncbi:Histone-fold-containing protein [Coniochaeta hoffmannii]|uniref:DNA polymerase epsilon subunit D n=1 Tax=Coniochaeta hoffmannii TaxID=91930 RepID=A0AA38SD58_9PEZI|nr:Histone-fold-containing protein [Coniochaeta hoffmannii]